MFVGLVVFGGITYNNILLFMITIEVTDLLCYENENYFSNITRSRSSIVITSSITSLIHVLTMSYSSRFLIC